MDRSPYIACFEGLKSAQFFRMKDEIDASEIEKLLCDHIAKSYDNVSIVDSSSHVEVSGLKWTILIFTYERHASFVLKDVASHPGCALLTERIAAYFLLVWEGKHDAQTGVWSGRAAVMKSNAAIPEFLEDDYLISEETERLHCVFGQEELDFEHITLATTILKKHGIKRRSYDGASLQGSMSISSGKRLLPRRMEYRRDGKRVAVAPGSARISEQSKRISLDGLLSWVQRMFNAISEATSTARFLKYFARPCSLSMLPTGVEPTYALIDVSVVESLLIGEASEYKLWKGDDEVSEEEWKDFRKLFSEPFEIDAADKEVFCGDRLPAGKLVWSGEKIRITIKDAENFIVSSSSEKMKMNRFIEREGLTMITFTDPRYSYVGGSLIFSDDLEIESGFILGFVESHPQMNNCLFEKHKDEAGHKLKDGCRNFPKSSIFYAIENHVSNDNWLFLDDLGDEWADYIGVSGGSGRPSITFYHAKQLDGSGATQFQEVVAQAIKNLGRLRLEHSIFEEKKASKAGEKFLIDKISTDIGRTRKGAGGFGGFVKAIENLNRHYDPERGVAIVLGGITRDKIEETLRKTTKDGSVEKSAVQLFWLLNVFIGSCLEAGVKPRIICG